MFMNIRKAILILIFVLLLPVFVYGCYKKLPVHPAGNGDLPSIGELLLLAKQPLGKTLYVWGGGWNEEDTGAGEATRRLGISPGWIQFAQRQDENYDYNTTRYQIHNGLDCSGYVGWVVYNLFEEKDGEEGYVTNAASMAGEFAKRGFGTLTDMKEVTDWQAGDIMSMKDHVWIVVGSCSDGSVVLLHASPPAVTLAGTRLSGKSMSIAEQLAQKYMRGHLPGWYEKYPNTSCDYKYLEESQQMRWSPCILSDKEGLRSKPAEEILRWMFLGQGL